MKWHTVTLILCVFGALKEFRPNEPFVTNYLTGPWKNFTAAQVNQEIYPVGTYCHFGLLVLSFLLTDFVRYKPAIVLCGLSGTCAYLIIRYGTTILHMQIVQLLYAIMMSTEVAYYTYIYAKVDKPHYQRVTGFTRCAFLFGRFMAGSVAQLTTSYGWLDYEHLNYLTMGAYVLATVWACFLPPVQQSIYFNRADGQPSERSTSLNDFGVVGAARKAESQGSGATLPASSARNLIHEAAPSFCARLRHAYYLLWSDFVVAYRDGHVVKWSLWWAFATCGYLQVVNYVQLLWQNAIKAQNLPADTEMYNGAVEAAYTIISAVIVIGIGQLSFNWRLLGEPILALFSLVEGLLLLLSCYTYNLWILYVAYVAFGVIYHSIITIANFEVAKYVSKDSYGLIFGINTFFALLFQSLLTFIVIRCLKLDVPTQYIVYGGYYVVLGAIFTIMSIFTVIFFIRNEMPLKIWASSGDTNSHSK